MAKVVFMRDIRAVVLSSLYRAVKNMAVAALCLLAVNAFAQTGAEDSRLPNEFIVMLKPGQKIDVFLPEIGAMAFEGMVTVKKCLSPRMNIYLLQRTTTLKAETFLFALQRSKFVKLAQFNHRVKQRSLIPDDTEFNNQWNMLNVGQNGTIGVDIDATEGWELNNDNVTADGDTTVVAVIDYLFDLGHEDLNFFVNYNEIPGNGIDDDGNGYIDDVNGWNVFTGNGDINGAGAGAGHSTHCAGIVGAIGNNGKGVAGVSWGTKILPVAGSSTQEANVVEAYNYVREMRLLYNNTFGTKGAYVVATNSSFGVDARHPADFPIWCAMYDSMGAVGILSATATSNSSADVDEVGDIPTECPSKWMISVTNTNWNDQRIAAFGKTSIDLGAPGFGIRSTVPPSSYGNMSGTSMACPHVAGTIAAMYSYACKSLIDKYYEQPDTVALLIKDYLLQGAEWNSTLNNRSTTNGRLNLYRSVYNLNKYNCDSCGFSAGINTQPVTCKNANDGAAEITVAPGLVSGYSIMWMDSSALPSRQGLSPGYYTARVTDTLSGCSRYVTTSYYNPDSISIISLLASPPEDGAPGTVVVQASAAFETLMYSIDSINYQPTSVFAVADTGTYNVYIKNSSGCIIERNITVAYTGINETDGAALYFELYPNPAADVLTVYCPQFARLKTPVEVFDVTGRKIFSAVPLSDRLSITTAAWQSGLYFVKLGNAEKKLVVTH